MPNTRFENAIRALDRVVRAAKSGSPAQIAQAADDAARVASEMRAAGGELFAATLHGEDGRPAGTARVLVDARGVTVRALPEGREHPFEVTVEIKSGAAVAILSGADWTDDPIALCHLDGGGVHIASGASDDAARFYPGGGGYANAGTWQPPVTADAFSARISGMAAEYGDRRLAFVLKAASYADGVDLFQADPGGPLESMVGVVLKAGKGLPADIQARNAAPADIAAEVAALMSGPPPASPKP